MSIPWVTKHSCGTVACHGGYGIIALGCQGDNFHEGADAIGRFLGFSGEDGLVNWASANSAIWGNKKGSLMFYWGSAFGVSDDAKLSHVVAHYLSVAKRLMELK